MRRSTTKAAAAILALSVALPALANDGDYFIGPDGSVEYRDSSENAAPTSAAPLADMMTTKPSYVTMQPVDDFVDAPAVAASPVIPAAPEAVSFVPTESVAFDTVPYNADPVSVSAPVVQELSMEVLTDASADVAPEPFYSEPYAAPMMTEIMSAPVMAQPMVMETYTQTPEMVAPVMAAPMMVEPVMAAPVMAAPAPVAYEPAPQPAMIEYVDAPVAQTFEADYSTLVDPTPLSSISALPMNAPSGLSLAERGDGGYGRSTIDRGGESEAGQSTDIFVSKSAIVNLPAEASEVSVSDPTAVRAVLRTARQIVLIGLRVGSTNVIAFDDNNKQILSLDINVRYDLRPLRAAIKRNFPNTLVEVESLLGEVVLTGAASGPGEATEIRNLVRRYLYSAMLGAGIEADPNSIEFVDRLATDSDDQVLLKVRVAEMRRSVVRQFGVDWSLASNVASNVLTNGLPGAVSAFDSISSNSGGLSANIAGSVGSTDFGSLVKALERHSVMRTLAEPTLTAVSGETASFLAGGQFPFPTSADDGEIGYEFRDFGVALEFTPVVVGDGRISLQIATEVSELTTEGEIRINDGLTIPGISVRRANTTVELPSGGTMSIAGMLLQRDSASQSGVPGIKNVPVVGQLFASNDFQRDETELVILVTPYVVKPGQERDFRLPTDGFAPASDMDFYLLGRLHKVYGAGRQDVAAARQALNAPLGFIIE